MATTTNSTTTKPSVLWVKVEPRKTSEKEANIRLFKQAVQYA
jgi:hypothetical protein